MSEKIDLSKLKDSKKYEIEYINIDEQVNADFVKQLRKKMNMTQLVFACILGVKKKTIEKWEQGKNPVKGTAARLLFVLNSRPEILNLVYNVSVIKPYNLSQIDNFIMLEEQIVVPEVIYRKMMNNNHEWSFITPSFISNKQYTPTVPGGQLNA